MKKLNICILLLLSFLGWSQAKCQNAGKDQLIPLDPTVRHGKLENGFTYYVLPNKISDHSVFLELVVKTGGLNESESQLEYAHLLEHLVASSTDNFPDVSEYLHEIGGYSNAHTADRYTVYYVTIPSNDKQKLNRVVKLLHDWAKPSSLDIQRIDLESAAIEGEARTASWYLQWIYNSIKREVLKNVRYPYHDQKLNLANLRAVNPKDLKNFYYKWYEPDIEAAVVVGDINPDSLEIEIRQQFTDLKSEKKAANYGNRNSYGKIHLDGGIKFSTVFDSLNKNLNLNIVHVSPNFDRNPKTIEDFKHTIVQKLYNFMIATRASDIKQQYDPPFNSFSAKYGLNALPDRQINASMMSLVLDPVELKKQKKAFQHALLTWNRMQKGFTDNDLEKSKKQLLDSYIPKDSSSSSKLAQELLLHFVFDRIPLISLSQRKIFMDILSEIDLEDIREYSEKYAGLSENTDFIFFKGRGTSIPSYEIVQKWTQEVGTMHIEPFKEKEAIRSLTNVVKSSTSDETEVLRIDENMIGVTTIQLSKGIKILLKPTKPRNKYFENKISIQAYRPNIVPTNQRREYLKTIVAPEVIQYMGAGPYSKFELNRFMNDRGINLRFQITKDNQLIHGESTFKELPELFNLLDLYMNQPRKDEKGFESWKTDKQKQLEGLAIRGSKSFIVDKIESVWYPKIPVLDMSDLKKIRMNEVFQAWKSWYCGIEDFTFIVTGDFDKDKLTQVLIKFLSAFPAKNEMSTNSKTKFNFPFQKMEKRLVYKNIDQVYTNLYFPVKVPSDLKSRIELQLLSMALNKNIYDRLRNGCYSPSASGEWLDFENGIFAFHIQFDSALGNEDFMKKEALEVFRELQENGVEEKWLKSTIKNEVNLFESQFNSFGYFNFWPDYLQSKLENGEDPVQGILNYGTLMENFIRLNEVNFTAKTFMQEKHLQQFTGYPEKYQ